jgi:hypothetical protein
VENGSNSSIRKEIKLLTQKEQVERESNLSKGLPGDNTGSTSHWGECKLNFEYKQKLENNKNNINNNKNKIITYTQFKKFYSINVTS